jgi:hypothetical protein
MFASPTLLSYLLLALHALSTFAAPVQIVGRNDRPSLAFSARVNALDPINIAEIDRARAAAIRAKAAAYSNAQNRRATVGADVDVDGISISISDHNVYIENGALYYTANVGVGNPPTKCT